MHRPVAAAVEGDAMEPARKTRTNDASVDSRDPKITLFVHIAPPELPNVTAGVPQPGLLVICAHQGSHWWCTLPSNFSRWDSHSQARCRVAIVGRADEMGQYAGGLGTTQCTPWQKTSYSIDELNSPRNDLYLRLPP